MIIDPLTSAHSGFNRKYDSFIIILLQFIFQLTGGILGAVCWNGPADATANVFESITVFIVFATVALGLLVYHVVIAFKVRFFTDMCGDIP